MPIINKQYVYFIIFLFILTNLNACGDSSSSKDPALTDSKEGQDGQPSEETGLSSGEEEATPGGGWISSSNRLFYVSLRWVYGPVVGENCTAEISFLDAQRKAPKSVARFSVFPWMSIHSHDSGQLRPTARIKSESEPNTLIVEGIYFHMPGPWELNVGAEVDGAGDTIKIEFEVP